MTVTTIPELDQACALHHRVTVEKSEAAQGERDYRALLLKAVAAGATRVQIQDQCDISPSFLDSELRKARTETADPKLRKVRLPHRGLTLGDYPCPDCTATFVSAQARGLHRVKMHNYRLAENQLTAQIVRKARKAPQSVATSDLARKYGVSYHALRAARSRKTWKSLAD